MKKRFKRIRQTAEYHIRSHQQSGGILGVLMQLLLLYFAVFATVLCISTSLAMNATVFEIVFICLLTTVLAAAACYNKISAGIALGSAGLLTLLLWPVLQGFFTTLQKALEFFYDLAFVIMKMRGWNYTSRMITSEERIAEILEDDLLVLSYARHVIITLAVLLALWYVALAWKRSRVWLPVALSLGIMVPGFTIGLVPSPFAFSLLLACAFGLYMQTLAAGQIDKISPKEWFVRLFTKRNRKERFAYSLKSGLYGICTAGISLVLMLLVALFTMRTPLIELDEIRTYLDEGSRYVYNQIFYSRLETPNNAIGNMVDGETLDVLKIPEIHSVPVLYVKSDKNEDTYLRAWVSDSFTKDGWTLLSEQDEKDYNRVVDPDAQPYSFAYQLHQVFVDERLEMETQESYGFELDNLEIKARFKKSLVAHLPSFGGQKLEQPLKDANFINKEMAQFEQKRPDHNTYTAQAFIPIITSKGYVGALHGLAGKYATLLTLDTSDITSKNFQTFKKHERSYYEYAKKHYLNYSGLTLSFQNKADELAEGHKTQLTKVLAIEQYFRDNTRFTYTIKPEKIKDATVMEQLEYSLNTKHEGYCSYYATAMTLMVRSLGYPARYVNGYHMKSTDDEPNKDGQYKRTVMDKDCHAWVEVYFTGLGWMSFDPTPDMEETKGDFDSRYYALELEKGTGDGEGENTVEQIGHVLSAAEQPDDNEVMPPLEIDYGIFGGAGLRIMMIILLAIVLLLLCIGAVVLYIKACLHSRDQYRAVTRPDAEGNPPDSALLVRRMHQLILRWLELKKLQQMIGETELEYARRIDQILATDNSFADLVFIFQKAEFGQQDLIEDQLHKVEMYFNELYYRFHHKKDKLPWWKKLKV